MRLAEDGKIRVSPVSRPFLVAAVILVFTGSIIGSVWMMYLLGVDIGLAYEYFALHKILQIDGFLTLIVMGVGYMIIPRFRNVRLSSVSLAYFSILLVIFSIATTITSLAGTDLTGVGTFARTLGIMIFAVVTLWTLRIRPRLLRTTDYFIALAVLTLLAANIMHLFGYPKSGNSLSEVQILLLFPVLMIFGVQFKTIPSFLGFIRPRKKLSAVSILLAGAASVLGLVSALHDDPILAVVFNAVLLFCAVAFANTLYTFGGFDNGEIVRLIQGEKKARYLYTIRYSRVAFIFLFLGITIALSFNISNSFILYDLAIHYVAIGFIGVTIALYLPLMLPPITGRMVHFTRINILPVLLVVSALAIRTTGDVAITLQRSAGVSYLLSSTGWLIVIALIVFVIMSHRSMSEKPIGGFTKL